jgi:ankyrin repeat protein
LTTTFDPLLLSPGPLKFVLVKLKLMITNNEITTMKKNKSIVWFGVLSLCSVLADPSAQAAPSPITPEYFAVLRNGDLQGLRDALDHGASANARDAEGNTPLMLAAVYADVSCAKLLLEGGAEVNVTNNAGATPLMRATFDYDKLRLLVDHGADVDARSALGNSALMLAARPANSHRAVGLLLSHGADAKATNNWGATALMAAAAGEDDASVRLLLKHGADVNAQSLADPVSFILGGARSPLMWAAYRGDTKIMKLLIAAGADVNGEGFFGTPLAQAAWADQTAAARLLIERGADVKQVPHGIDYTALHWAASSEHGDASLVNLLLNHGADPNIGGGEHIEAFMEIPQTPLMMARRRGETPILAALTKAGATHETLDEVPDKTPPARQLPEKLDAATLRSAISQAIAPLQETSITSKQNFVKHELHQDCTSCHQQYLPLAAIGFAKRQHVQVDADAERQLVEMVHQGELKNPETDWQALFHPDPANTKGYTLFGWAADNQPADEFTDSEVQQLTVIQGKDGRWFNNIPRPPIQTSDVGPTALAIHALQRYPLPGRKTEFAERVDRARKWLWTVKSENTEERIYQILGLAWAGESPNRLQSLAKTLLAQQHADGGWSQLPVGKSDAFATGQAVYALRVGAGIASSDPAIDRARRYLLQTQLEDGTWYVHRRTFPFQPTMKSGFPHGRDGWISSAATSWAVLALSLPEETKTALTEKPATVARGY